MVAADSYSVRHALPGRFHSMRVGLIGAGNMARALARGWGDPVLCSDAGSGRARELAQAQGVRNVTFERADAQVHPLPQKRFDLAISRFGTMFFADPVAAFGNAGRALRPAARVSRRTANEWSE